MTTTTKPPTTASVSSLWASPALAEGITRMTDDSPPKALWLVGQAPARSATPETRPWDSASGRRLASWMGTDIETLLANAETMNLNPTLLGTNGKWDIFDKEWGKVWAEVIRSTLEDIHYPTTVFCLGKSVCTLMGVKMFEWTELVSEAGAVHQLTGMPHPGGTNFYWNKTEHLARGKWLARSVWESRYSGY